MHWEELGVQMIDTESLEDHSCPTDIIKRGIEELGHLPRGQCQLCQYVFRYIECIAWVMLFWYHDGGPFRVREDREEGEVFTVFPDLVAGCFAGDDLAENARFHALIVAYMIFLSISTYRSAYPHFS